MSDAAVTGSALYRQRIAIPVDTVLRVRLEVAGNTAVDRLVARFEARDL